MECVRRGRWIEAAQALFSLAESAHAGAQSTHRGLVNSVYELTIRVLQEHPFPLADAPRTRSRTLVTLGSALLCHAMQAWEGGRGGDGRGSRTEDAFDRMAEVC